MPEFFHHLLHALEHTVKHNFYMLPLLFIVYLLIEILEHKAMDKIKKALSSPHLGLFGAAALGLFPQCGFSVAAANLYSERLISAGAVAAIFIATSDEALPMLVAEPKWLLVTILLKFFFAVLVGAMVNLIFRFTKLDADIPKSSLHTHAHSAHIHEAGEHHHCSHCDSNSGIFKTATVRALSIFLFLFVTGFVLNLVIELIGENSLEALLMNGSIFQPFIAALIGLIPNCAASVITTTLFLEGTIGFGSLMASLCVGSGVGALMLFRVNRNIKQNLAIMGILYFASALFGVIITLIA